ncbi:MAG: hypothetical protein RL885_15495 [Planctomycetota bacterium]
MFFWLDDFGGLRSDGSIDWEGQGPGAELRARRDPPAWIDAFGWT